MTTPWKYFLTGALSMFIFVVFSYVIYIEIERNSPSQEKSFDSTLNSQAVTIKTLPSLLIMHGTDVAFEGKVELLQPIGGRFAQDIIITNFQATGENAKKSFIKIVWENGEVEKIYPGTKDKQFLGKRAVEISIVGYSVHERRIFKDSDRKGTLTWEIRYQPIET